MDRQYDKLKASFRTFKNHKDLQTKDKEQVITNGSNIIKADRLKINTQAFQTVSKCWYNNKR